jgi:hypothetical protein
MGPHSLRLGEAIYNVLRPAGFSDQAVVGTVYAPVTYILGFVALEIPRAGLSPQTSEEFVRRMWAFSPPSRQGSFPTPSSWPRSWPGSPPTTSSSSASVPSWRASKPSRLSPRSLSQQITNAFCEQRQDSGVAGGLAG